MRLRSHLKPARGHGLPTVNNASIVTAPEFNENAGSFSPAQVAMFVRAELPLECKMVASLRLSPAEARDLAAKLVNDANKAEEMTRQRTGDPRPFFVIEEVHVDKWLVRAFGREWRVTDFMGRILPGDVGKRVYLMGDTAKAFDAFLQVENDEQRDKRLGRTG